MAIKDRWNRFRSHKSASSSASSLALSSAEDAHIIPTHPTAPAPTAAGRPRGHTTPSGRDGNPPKPPGLLSKTFSWRTSAGAFGAALRPSKSPGSKKNKSGASDATTTTGGSAETKAAIPRRKLHPSERPLTKVNLKHQEMLSGFTIKFGRTGGPCSSLGGVSPCTSRRASIDEEYGVPF